MMLNGYFVGGHLNMYSLLLIVEAIRNQMWLMQRAAHPLKDLVEKNNVYDMVMNLHNQEGIELFINQHGLPSGAIGFSEAPLWWAKKGSSVLVEEFVVSLRESGTGFGRIAAKRLEEIARIKRCSLLMAGNLLGLNSKQTENLYMKKSGFHMQYGNFIKVL